MLPSLRGYLGAIRQRGHRVARATHSACAEDRSARNELRGGRSAIEIVDRRSQKYALSKAIARAMLSAWPDRSHMIERAGHAVGYPWTFLQDLVDRVLAQRHPPPPSLRQLTLFIAHDPGFLGVWSNGERGELDESDDDAIKLGCLLEVERIFIIPSKMAPARAWPVPKIETEAELRELLHLTERELEQLAGHARSDRRAPEGPLRNYLYRWKQKPGSTSPRLIEAPQRRLKIAQRTIARTILDQVQPDEAAHGFRTGRSILTHASQHAGRDIVLRMDLAEFFPSITAGRVIALFRTIGYPEHVARLLATLTTNATPADVLRDPRARENDDWRRALLRKSHIPQGAPSSPSIANLCALHLDRRLAGLARRFGVTYSRYADDLVFSGNRSFGSVAERFAACVTSIAFDEGFRVNARKTRLMRAGVQQRVTGLVVNERPNVSRHEYEQLKAILHNAARFGPDSQNRAGHPNYKAHLEGRVAYIAMINPARGEKLLASLADIDWPSEPA